MAWIILGGLAGWAANVVVSGRNRRPQGCLFSVLAGSTGAVLGGLIYQLATGHERPFGFDVPSFGIAVLGTATLLAVLRTLAGRRSRRR